MEELWLIWQHQIYKALGVAFKKKQHESKQSLSKTGKLLPWAGEDHPAALSDCEDEDAFLWEP